MVYCVFGFWFRSILQVKGDDEGRRVQSREITKDSNNDNVVMYVDSMSQINDTQNSIYTTHFIDSQAQHNNISFVSNIQVFRWKTYLLQSLLSNESSLIKMAPLCCFYAL